MPETRECICCGVITEEWFDHICKNDGHLFIKDLWIDLTSKEAEKHSPDGQAIRLTNTSPPFLRGNPNSQTPLFPPTLEKNKLQPNPPLLQSYALVRVAHSQRALILDFKQLDEDGGRTLFLKVCYLTHTCVQIYTIAQWRLLTSVPRALKTTRETKGKRKGGQKKKGKGGKTSVQTISSDEPEDNGEENLERAKIGLAIEMEDYVLAFMSHDLVFEPIWKEKREDIPKMYNGVYEDYDEFLERVVVFVQKWRKDPKREVALARDEVRLAQETFFGVGVYTICELFFDAGLPFTITMIELVDCPSRMARLCEALWAYAHQSYKEVLPKLVRPAMATGIVAPTEEQRLGYARYLHVWAKPHCHVPPRMRQLINEWTEACTSRSDGPVWYRVEASNFLFDPFDPYFIRRAFEKNLKKTSLECLIWGPHESALIVGVEGPHKYGDPLSRYYQSQNLLDSPTWLKPGHYTDGGIISCNYKNHVRSATYCYVRSKKQIWSVIPRHPENCGLHTSRAIDSTEIIEFTGDQKTTRTLAHIVKNTKKVSIGPLEYSANGTQWLTTHRVKQSLPFKNSSYRKTMAFYRSESAAASRTSVNTTDVEVDNDEVGSKLLLDDELDGAGSDVLGDDDIHCSSDGFTLPSGGSSQWSSEYEDEDNAGPISTALLPSSSTDAFSSTSSIRRPSTTVSFPV